MDWGTRRPWFVPPKELLESSASSCSNRSTPCSTSSESGDSWSFAGESQDSGQVGEGYYPDTSDMSHERSSLTGEEVCSTDQREMVNGAVGSDNESGQSVVGEGQSPLVEDQQASPLDAGAGALPFEDGEEQSPLVDGVAEELSLVGEGGEVASPSVEGMMEESSLMAEGMGVGSSPSVQETGGQPSPSVQGIAEGPFSLGEGIPDRDSPLGEGMFAEAVGGPSPFVDDDSQSPAGFVEVLEEKLAHEAAEEEAAMERESHSAGQSREVSPGSADTDTVITNVADSTVGAGGSDDSVNTGVFDSVNISVSDDTNVPDSTVTTDDVPEEGTTACSPEEQTDFGVSGSDPQTSDRPEQSMESASPTEQQSPGCS